MAAEGKRVWVMKGEIPRNFEVFTAKRLTDGFLNYQDVRKIIDSGCPQSGQLKVASKSPEGISSVGKYYMCNCGRERTALLHVVKVNGNFCFEFNTAATSHRVAFLPEILRRFGLDGEVQPAQSNQGPSASRRAGTRSGASVVSSAPNQGSSASRQAGTVSGAAASERAALPHWAAFTQFSAVLRSCISTNNSGTTASDGDGQLVTRPPQQQVRDVLESLRDTSTSDQELLDQGRPHYQAGRPDIFQGYLRGKGLHVAYAITVQDVVWRMLTREAIDEISSYLVSVAEKVQNCQTDNEAIMVYTRAIQAHADKPKHVIVQADLLKCRAVLLVKGGLYEFAVEDTAAALELHREASEALNREYNQARTKPLDYEILECSGRALLCLGDVQKAKEHFQLAMKTTSLETLKDKATDWQRKANDLDNLMEEVRIATIKSVPDDLDGALRTVKKALKIGRACPVLMRTKCNLLALAGHWDELSQWLVAMATDNFGAHEVAQAVSGKHPFPYFAEEEKLLRDGTVNVSAVPLLLYHYDLGEWLVRALRFLDKSIQAKNCLETVDMIVDLGLTSLSVRMNLKWTRVQRDMLERIDIGRANAKSFDDAKQYRAAIKEYQACLEIDRPYGHGSMLHFSLHLELARLLMKMSRYAAAAKHFTFVLDTSPDNEEALLNRGECFSVRRDIASKNKALNDFTAVLTMYPNHLQALLLRGDLYRDLGDNTVEPATSRDFYSRAVRDYEHWRHAAYTNPAGVSESIDFDRTRIKLEEAQQRVRELTPATPRRHRRSLSCGSLSPTSFEMLNYYKRLGVSEDAPLVDMKRAFYRLSKVHHPDKGGRNSIMVLLNQAWGTLSTEDGRRRYDYQLSERAARFARRAR